MLTKTEKAIIAQLTENTGIALCDSGGFYIASPFDRASIFVLAFVIGGFVVYPRWGFNAACWVVLVGMLVLAYFRGRIAK